MPILPIGEWLPDGPQLGNPGTVTALNCVPRTATTYGPFPGPMPYGSALPSQVIGDYGFRDAGGVAYNFAGTATDLWLQKTGSPDFASVSGPTAPYHTEQPPDGFWSITSFGNRIIASNYDDAIQSMLIGTDAAFSDLSTDLPPTDAPRGRFVQTIKDFLMVADTTDSMDGAVHFRLHWSAIGDPLYWPEVGTNEAIEVQRDFQDLQQTDLGGITGLVGGHLSAADGCAFMERGIYRISYAGSPEIFNFAVAEGAAGTSSPLSLVVRRLPNGSGVLTAVVYYLSSDGFCAFDGSGSTPIGAQKIDRFFYGDIDNHYLRNVQGTYDPTRKLCFWFYHGTQNNGFYNRVLVFSPELQRWTVADMTATPVEWAAGTTYSTAGYNLDQMDVLGPIDQLKFSMDSRVWTEGNPIALTWFDTNHIQNSATGGSLPCTIDTTEGQLHPGFRSRLINSRPLVDSQLPVTIAVGTRETTRQAVTYHGAIPENILGSCPQRCTGRYVRFRVTIPHAANFQHIQGVDWVGRPEGIR